MMPYRPQLTTDLGPEAPPAPVGLDATRERTCLRCDGAFLSRHRAHRLCHRCGRWATSTDSGAVGECTSHAGPG